jgi:radical SAM protein with 4Fe4S-binding SPASM domain
VKPIVTLGARVIRSNFGRGPRPFKLTLIVTFNCDTRCKMCNIWKRGNAGVMTLGEVEAFFDRNPHFSWINLSGGEIWTRPDMDDVAAAIIARSPDLFLLDFPTTGQQTERIVEGVERVLTTRLPKLLVTVSLDGPREVHEDIRGRVGAWDNAVATFARLRRLRSKRFDVFLGMTLSNFNEGALFATIDSVREVIPDLALTEFHVNVAQVSSHYYENEELERTRDECLADVAEFLRQKGHAFHPVGWLERRYQKLSAGFLESGKTPLPCKALASSVFVDPRWNVFPCSMYDAPLGNLRDRDFDLGGLWREERTKQMQREIAAGKCPHCWTPCEAYQTIMGNVLRPAR